MKYTIIILLQFLLFLSLSCAKQTSPTGGPKDTIPPSLEESFPKNKTINFKGKSIQLVFDEMVIVNNPREQLIITPSVGKDVEMTARKKTVLLEFNSPLDDSTTYTINFRESVQDITEKNAARNLQLAFSTGTYIDSLSIKGNVNELLTGKEVKDATVALYLNPDTFNIFKHKPSYLTKTNDKGNFLIENLKPGKYYIYAFLDKNKNIIVDSRSERYGFLTTPIDLQPGFTPTLEIPILPLDARELKLVSARPNNTYFNIRTSKPISSYALKSDYPDSLYFHNYGEDQANIRVYIPLLKRDSIALQFHAADTIGFQIDTLVYAKLSDRKATPERFQVSSVNNSTILQPKHLFNAQIKVNKPVIYFTYDSIIYQADSLNFITFGPDDIQYTQHNGLIKLVKSLPKEIFDNPEEDSRKPDIKSTTPAKSKSKYNKLYIGKGAFISADLDSSNLFQENVSFLSSQNTGTILAEINTDELSFILQLVTRDLKIVKESKNNKSVTFDNISPGDYFLRLIIDHNANQVWDFGNFYKRVEPEPIVLYRNDEGNPSISLKANWELGPLLITYPKNVDKL